jgi:serine/threonine protein kinase/tetratricopeptide (TPR) repeat protein
MTLEEQARSVFLAALERTPDAWPGYLDDACAENDLLRARVEELLAGHQALGSIHAHGPAVPEGTLFQPVLEQPGTVIGPYKLLQQIGEGGFGVVFMAEQTAPVRRKVALKVIKPGMDTRQVIARFEAERQALAVMDHPNIARVLDAGATESGRPFFVMELVRGVPITTYCDENNLPIRERLTLFATVCQAIQHAHTKGIIHRDIKPSNVLVTRQDGQPLVKVIDFGVAKAMGQQLTDKTLFTEFAQMIGTPLYMSPEQAELSSVDIDTRSDIYSLGVMLYELLTGTTPVSKEQLKQAAFDEIRRIIREEDPPKPSTRISTSEAAPSIAAHRQTEPARLTKLVRGELDWIAMKALEKDRNRRYETASSFAADVQRFLEDEPVLACPPSTAYKLKKFARRNWAAVLTAGTILLLLVVGIVGATFGLIWAENRRQEAENARAAEEEQRKIADAQKKRAEQAEADTLADFRASTDEAIEQLIGSKPELGPKEMTYLKKTLERWQAFAARQADDAAGQAIRAEGHFRVASLWQKLGRPDEARVEYETARGLYHKLATTFPSVPRHRQDIATTHHNLGMLLYELGQYDAARAEYQTARNLQQKLADEFPAAPQYRHELALTCSDLGALLVELGERDAGAAEYESARDLEERLAEEFPSAPQYRQELSRAHNRVALLFLALGQREEAQTEFEAAHALKQKLADEFPGVPTYQRDLAVSHNNLGLGLVGLGQFDLARKHYEAALDLKRKLVSDFPATPHYRNELAGAHTNLGNLLLNVGEHEAAGAEHKSACDLLENLVVAFPNVPEYQVLLGCTYNNLGHWLSEEGKSAESLHWYDLSVRTLTPVYEADRRSVKVKSYLRNSLKNRAWTYDKLRRYAEGAKDWDKATELNPTPTYVALTVYREALRSDPDNAWLNCRLAWFLGNRRGTSLHEAKQAVRAAKKAVTVGQEERDHWRTLGIAQYRAESWTETVEAITKSMELSQGGDSLDWFFLAMAHWQLGEKDKARQWYDQAVEWMDKNQPKNEELRRFRAEAAELLELENKTN